jgi:serine/threonine protein phosphatase PrpC
VLATDGLTNVLDDQVLLHIVDSASNPHEAVEELIEAVASGGASDDATCITAFIR